MTGDRRTVPAITSERQQQRRRGGGCRQGRYRYHAACPPPGAGRIAVEFAAHRGPLGIAQERVSGRRLGIIAKRLRRVRLWLVEDLELASPEHDSLLGSCISGRFWTL